MGLDDCQRSAKYLCKNVRTTVAEAAGTLTALAAFGAVRSSYFERKYSVCYVRAVVPRQLTVLNSWSC
jgi:hypothetical protein